MAADSYQDYYGQLNDQTGGFGNSNWLFGNNSGTSLTNEALRNNSNLSSFLTKKNTYGLYSPSSDDLTRGMVKDPNATTFGLTDSQWGGLAVGGQLLGGLTGAYTGLEQLGLAKKQYALQEDMLNKQYNMAKDAYDRNVKRAEHIGNQMNRSATVVGEANG